MQVEETPCPECGVTGSLDLSIRLVAHQVGDFSLAGVQMKFSARDTPVLGCGKCGFELYGEIDDNENAVFHPGATTRSDT